MAEDPKLVEARRRVSKAERRALDRASALRDEALTLLEAAKVQAQRLRDAATADAQKLRSETSESDGAAQTEIARLTAELEALRAE